MTLDEIPLLVGSSLHNDLLCHESFNDLEKQTNLVLKTIKNFFGKKDFYVEQF